MRKGTMIFNAGIFSNTRKLQEEQRALPITELDSQRMIASVTSLLVKYLPDGVPRDPNVSDLMTGIVTVKDGKFSAELYYEMDDLRRYTTRPILKFIPGIPHGFGDLVAKTRDSAANDPTLAATIAANPRKELLQILSDEASDPRSLVGPPYTVLLLHPDGTISDYSEGKDSDYTDGKKCVVPEDATPPKPKQKETRGHN